MKKSISLILSALLLSSISYSNVPLQSYHFSGNNICNYFYNNGVFNQKQGTSGGYVAGLYWQCNPNQSYCFTSGFNMAGKINGQLAMFSCAYQGELAPGYILKGIPYTNSDFKIYGVKRYDDEVSNPDFANWYKMVPYGAPYIDVNNNCIFEPGIDKPGIADASQTLFICMTDAFIDQKIGGGFGGGITSPLFYAEIRLTAWSYDWGLSDVQFLKYQVINKGSNNWDSAYFTYYADPDVQEYNIYGNGDYIGCDTSRSLGFAYCGNPNYLLGAYGVRILKGPVIKQTGDTLKMTSFTHNWTNSSACETLPILDALGAYHYMMGYKKDMTPYLDPTYSPARKTKFVFSGDPETNTGWTPLKGYVGNCGTDTGSTNYVAPWDARFHLNTGAANLSIAPGDTQSIYYAQMITKGSSNTNSVTRLKGLSDVTNTVFKRDLFKTIESNCSYYECTIPEDFSLAQNFPNPFNSSTIIKYNVPRSAFVKIVIYDLLGREVSAPVNGQTAPGYYELNVSSLNLASGV